MKQEANKGISKSQLLSIYNNIVDGIISINNRGIIEAINPAATKLFGYEENEVIGRNVSMLMPEPYHSEHNNYIGRYKKTGEKKIIGLGREVVGRKKNGSLFPFFLSISEIKQDEEHAFIGIIHDLSRIRNTEAALISSQSKIRSIIDTAADGIVTMEKDGTLESVNPAACHMFGYTEAQLVGQNVSILMPEPDKSQHDHYLRRYHKTREKHIIGTGREVMAQHRNGSQFPIRLSVSEAELSDRTIYTGIIHDITKLKQNEEKLRVYAHRLERSNRELENFAYISSHDLQEPLRKIQAFGSRIKDTESDGLSDKGQDYLKRIVSASGRMQALINDLLEFSRLTSRAQPFKKADLSKIVAEAISDLQMSIDEKNAVIKVNKLPVIDGDATQLRQLFQNLIGNSLKFSRDSVQPVINISFRIFLDEYNEEYIEIVLADNGIGFEQKYADRIFNIFQRLESKKYQGSGIGLAICKKVVNRHGGSIDADSEPGTGTKFKFTLKTKQQDNEK